MPQCSPMQMVVMGKMSSSSMNHSHRLDAMLPPLSPDSAIVTSSYTSSPPSASPSSSSHSPSSSLDHHLLDSEYQCHYPDTGFLSKYPSPPQSNSSTNSVHYSNEYCSLGSETRANGSSNTGSSGLDLDDYVYLELYVDTLKPTEYSPSLFDYHHRDSPLVYGIYSINSELFTL